MKRLFSLLLIVAGCGLIMYSVWQIWQTNQLQEKAIVEAKERINQSPIKKTNATEADIKEPVTFHAEKGEKIGLLKVPLLDRELPIIAGVDEEELKQGVGHYPGTYYPGQEGQIVLSGHRDTVFRRFGELSIGDTFIVEMPYGTYEYTIVETEIVSADDLTVIRPEDYDEEILTVTTCYPFRYIGDAPDRFIFYAKPVKSD